MQDTRPRLEPRPRAAASVRVEEGPTPAARPTSPVLGGVENSVQNGLHALATVVMHNVRPEASGKRLPMTLHRLAHVRKDDAASAIAHPEPSCSLVHSRTLRWLPSNQPPDGVASRVQISFKVL